MTEPSNEYLPDVPGQCPSVWWLPTSGTCGPTGAVSHSACCSWSRSAGRPSALVTLLGRRLLRRLLLLLLRLLRLLLLFLPLLLLFRRLLLLLLLLAPPPPPSSSSSASSPACIVFVRPYHRSTHTHPTSHACLCVRHCHPHAPPRSRRCAHRIAAAGVRRLAFASLGHRRGRLEQLEGHD